MDAAPGLKRSTTDLSIDELDELPDGMSHEMYEKIRDAAGLQALSLGFDIDLDIKPHVRSHATTRGYPTVLLRVVLMAAGIWVWCHTENTLKDLMDHHGKGEPIKLHLSDYGQKFFSPLKDWL
jgi:hypothetical protein